jgi:hypothetical protein
MTGFIEPCLPSKVDRPPTGPLWVHEIKHDGYRCAGMARPVRVFPSRARVRARASRENYYISRAGLISIPRARARARGKLAWSVRSDANSNRIAAVLPCAEMIA